MALDVGAVLRFSRELQQALTARDLLAVTRAAVRRATPYRTVWLAAFQPGPRRMVQLLAISGEGAVEDLALEQAATFPADGDPMLEEIFSGTAPVVVADARTDPRTDKAMVARLGNRTIINVPLLIGSERLGALGIGTYHPEPPIPPTAEQLELLVVFATQVAAAFQRIQLQEAQRQLHRQLQASQRLESVALLAGGVAHDFNNLLTTILAGLEAVGDGPLTATQREELAAVTEAASRCADLTRHLLAVGRRQSLQLAPLDLAPQLRALLRLVRRMLPRTVEVIDEVPGSLPAVIGDAGQLDQVVLNLCLNARDAMPSGGRLTVAASVVEAGGAAEAVPGARRPGPHLAVVVSDTGHGMPPDVLERVFEPFFTTKALGQGTGIGLAVAAGIAEQHGGAIDVTSAPGAGSTFRLLLPVGGAAA